MFDGKSRRVRERLKLELPARVKGREHADYEWTEMTRLLDVTPFGARFTLARSIREGRLLRLTLGMPRQLRCYDYFEPQYDIWGLVRNVRTVEEEGAPDSRFEVGVAFIGKHPPASYDKNPTSLYEIDQTRDKDGMWELREFSEDALKIRQEDRRKDTRVHMPVEVVVEVLNDKGEVTASEQTVTENISRRGAAVFTTMQVERGGFVRLRSAQFDFAVSAVVRARRAGADGIPRLHLEFIGRPWPLEGVE